MTTITQDTFSRALISLLPGRDNAGARAKLRAAFAHGGVDAVVGCAATIAFQRNLGHDVAAAAREAVTPRPAVITRRTRNLGLGWTNDVERDERGGLRVRRPTTPDVTGTVREVLAELDRARRVNSGGIEWRRAWFLAGRPIVEAHGIGMESALELLTAELPASERGRGGSRFLADTAEVIFLDAD